jgi:glucosyl-dolichyl phosphate glucuronosyltransferase
MKLDIIIATYNRSALLTDCIDSLLRCESAGDWGVTVVDNNSSDQTRRTVETFAARDSRVRYLFEGRQGKGFALNLGICSSDANVIGMIDDDELVDTAWIKTVYKWFQDSSVDFLSGPYLGLWRTEKPPWFPPGFEGVISAGDPERLPKRPVRFAENDKVFAQGGNVAIRREIFNHVGLYLPNTRREDVEMFGRLMKASLNGYFDPGMIIYHAVTPERMTRRYYRQWVWNDAKAWARMDREEPQKVAHLGRVPRYLLGRAVRKIPALAHPNPSFRFAAELEWWKLAGYALGAYRPA